VPFYVAGTASSGTAGVSYSVSYLPDTTPPIMTPGSPTRNGAYSMAVDIPTDLPYIVLASTNLANWEPIFTNNTAGLLNFTDWDSTNYPARFYRMSWSSPYALQVSAPQTIASAFQMRVTGDSGEAWAVQISTDLVNWVSIFTNQAGGTMDFADTNAASFPHRFYRACLVTPTAPVPGVLNVTTNLALVRISNASLPYTVAVSTNSGQWTPLATNFAIGEFQTTATSATGGGGDQSTFLRAAQPEFMTSQAFGLQSYLVVSNSVTNAWMQFAFTKTNGTLVTIAITNTGAGNSVALTSQMFNAINSNPALEGSDGVQAEDLASNTVVASFNVYARSPGLASAQIQVHPQCSANVYMTTPQGPLTKNFSNLELRNHLYVTAGASRLALTFPLATTNFADGYHELTAVAYEGSDVRTETQTTVPVQIQNSSLGATLTVLDVTNSMTPAGDSFQIQVAANTNNVSLITLFGMGGPFASATNESTATFQVAGTNFWAGQLPFYAIVQTASGLQYRTQTQWVTITP
jgi:hypothetical protein